MPGLGRVARASELLSTYVPQPQKRFIRTASVGAKTVGAAGLNVMIAIPFPWRAASIVSSKVPPHAFGERIVRDVAPANFEARTMRDVLRM
jgi:hypothetical protein